MDIAAMPVLQVLMLAVMFLAVFVEIKTGGLGAGVLLGLVAAGVFWGSQYVKGLVDLYQVGLFLGGILLLIIEILLPTVGLLAGLGIAMILYSVVLALGGDVGALYALAVALLVAIAAFVLILKRLPASRLWNKIVLKDASTADRGYRSAPEESGLLGRQGIVLTELRPSGSIILDGKPIDVVSEGAYIEKGEKVEVISVTGSRVVVRKIEE